MINISSLDTKIQVVGGSSEAFYLVRWAEPVSWYPASAAALLVFDADGIQTASIPVIMPASLFFDTEGNYYVMNASNKIAYIHMLSGEDIHLDELPGQSPWETSYEGDFIFLAKLINDTFMTSYGQNYNTLARYSLSGTLLEQRSNIVSQGQKWVHYFTSWSTDGQTTSLAVYYEDTSVAVLLGTSDYSSGGLPINFSITNTYDDETGGTIQDGKLYTKTEGALRIRDMATLTIIEDIPITNKCHGSIGHKLVAGLGAFDGDLKALNVQKTVISTFINEFGVPVLYTIPGRKIITLSVNVKKDDPVYNNLDEYLNAETNLVSARVKSPQGEFEDYEVKSIKAGRKRRGAISAAGATGASPEAVRGYEVILHTPIDATE